jgi:hypothetical protein
MHFERTTFTVFFVYKAIDNNTEREKHFKELWKETEATLYEIIFLGICSLSTNFGLIVFQSVTAGKTE